MPTTVKIGFGGGVGVGEGKGGIGVGDGVGVAGVKVFARLVPTGVKASTGVMMARLMPISSRMMARIRRLFIDVYLFF